MQLRFWNKLLFFSFLLFSQYACSVKPLYVLRDAASDYIPPDYSNPDNWAALPTKRDSADALPDTIFRDIQDHAAVDVFFLHPTSYTGDRGQRYWNAQLDDQEVNLKTDQTSILHQASIFNGAGKVYAPRYRQAHIYAYFTKKNKSQAREAFELAYQDVVAAFKYYLAHYNHGRPVIIACHSQGSTHGMRLLKEFFDDKDLQDRLVVAYLLGMPVNKNYFNQIPVCETPDQTGCFCSWRTYKSGYLPNRFPVGDSIAVVNPLSWTTDHNLVEKDKNKGAILRNYHQGIWPNLTDARIEQGVLWAGKPHFPFSFLLRTKNYHAGDFNLYWLNVRENAQARVHSFLKESEH